MVIIYSWIVILVCINLGNSLESTRNQSPSKERYQFFDAELLQAFNHKENTNLLISPISIKLVLGMLMEGAEDKTANEIRAALRLPFDEEERRKEFSTWFSLLQVKDSPNVLKIANRMFISNRYNVSTDYGKTLKKFYSGGVTRVKFEDPKEASKMINEWVGNQTSQLIPSIVEEDQIKSDSALMLTSAIYFKGLWSSPFASERTSVRCFYSRDNKCKDAVMMMETGYFDYGYISRLDAKVIVLPYKRRQFSMLLLLPTRKDGVELLCRDLLHVSFSSILSELQEEEVFVQIPQFELSYNEDLVETLKKVQISEVFGEKANLSKIFTSHLESAPVNHIYHSAKITVNEEGSEGAAATGAMFVPLMGGTTTYFVANHPFLFFVINSVKNTVLFAGKVVSPQPPESPNKRIFTPNPNNIVAYLNSHANRTNSTETNTKEIRRPSSGPKFRAIKPLFTPSRDSSKEKGLSTLSPRFGNSYQRSLAQKTLSSGFLDNQKRGKTVQELPAGKGRKRQEQDDWRHHVLLFT